MIYYLQDIQEFELKDRALYLYRVFHKYFIKIYEKRNFICLESFPATRDGVCFLTGHDTAVKDFLSEHLPAHTLVLNTCSPDLFLDLKPKYEHIYICKMTIGQFAQPRPGYEYNINFDILDSELLLLHSKATGDIGRIRDSYDAL